MRTDMRAAGPASEDGMGAVRLQEARKGDAATGRVATGDDDESAPATLRLKNRESP